MAQRLIDADAMQRQAFEDNFAGRISDGMLFAVNWLLERAPTVDVVPVRHGKWKWLSCTYDRVPREKEYECSECHHKTIVHGDDMPWEKYCPNCGARMDEE